MNVSRILLQLHSWIGDKSRIQQSVAELPLLRGPQSTCLKKLLIYLYVRFANFGSCVRKLKRSRILSDFVGSLSVYPKTQMVACVSWLLENLYILRNDLEDVILFSSETMSEVY